jgi:hypothetical protein
MSALFVDFLLDGPQSKLAPLAHTFTSDAHTESDTDSYYYVLVLYCDDYSLGFGLFLPFLMVQYSAGKFLYLTLQLNPTFF